MRAKARRLPNHLGFALVSLLAAAGCTSRMGDVEVRDARGAPCIGLPRSEAPRDGYWLYGLDVYDVTGGVTLVWSLAAGDAPPRLARDACVSYGAVPAGYTGEAAPALVEGHLYEASVGASTNGPMGRSNAYSTKFCVARGPDGALHTVPLDPESRAWRDGVCPKR